MPEGNWTTVCELHSQGAWTEKQCRIIWQTRSAIGAISFIGCLFILVAIWISRRYRNFIQRLITYLSIASLLGTFSYFVGESHATSTATCNWQGFWMTWLDWSILLWVCCILHSMYINAVKIEPSDEWERTYLGIAWGLGALVGAISLGANLYGEAGLWCWLTEPWAQFAFWYIPLFVILVGMISAIVYITHFVNDREKQWQGSYNPEIESQKQFMKDTVKPLKWYPLVYVVCSIFGFINRFQNYRNPGEPIFWLYMVHSLTYPLIGGLNAMVYASNTDSSFWREFSWGNVKRRLTIGQEVVRDFPMQTGSLSDHIVNDNDEDGDDDCDDEFDA